MRLFQRFFKLSQSQRKPQQGFDQTFILEPILTPSGLVDIDGGDDGIDIGGSDIDLPDIADIDLPEPILDPLIDDADIEPVDFFDSDVDGTPDDSDFDLLPLDNLSDKISVFEQGVFTVGDSGEISVDFLFDGGGYQGELAIFNLEGMDGFDFNNPDDFHDFILEASQRVLSDSEMGHVVISDLTEGARFSGTLPEGNFNSGDYQGVTTVQMNPGDNFAVMLVPNGSVQRISDLLEAGEDLPSKLQPLFSLSTANPDDAFHLGQIADVTGDGNTFALEDLRTDGWTDQDYNDIVFQVRGATGEAVDLDEVVNPNNDWRGTDIGQELVEYAEESQAEYAFLTDRIWNDAENRSHLLNAFLQSNDSRFEETIDILQTAAVTEDLDLSSLETQLSEQVPILEEALNDPSNQEILQTIQTNIVEFTPGFDSPNPEIAEVFTETVERYGGAGYVGNASGGVVRMGDGYIQRFDSGGAGSGAILYGNGYEQAIFLSGEEWQEFQANGGVSEQGYPTEHQLPSLGEGDPIDLPSDEATLPTPDDGEVQPLDSPTSPIYTNPTNGNRYFLTERNSWIGAQNQARAAGGNLVTINNAAEQAWLNSTFGNTERLWIGLTDSERYGATEGNFRWVSGESVTYTNWHPVEPNNILYTSEGEDFVEMNFDSSHYSNGRWNDLPIVDGTGWTINFRGIAEIVNRAPVVTASNQTAYPYQTIIPSFSARDPEGNPITSYAFYDGNSSSTSGYFTVNGVRQAAGRTFYVPSNQINNVRFVGGSNPGDDRVYVAARDNYLWGNWTNFNINTDSARNTLATARNITLGQTLTEYVSEYDGNDYYRFTVNDRSRVNLSLSGLSADADLGLLDAYGNVVASSMLGGTNTDSINRELNPGTYYVRVNRYSGKTNYTLSTSAQIVQQNHPPVVSASNQRVRPNQAIVPNFSVNDPDGNAITRYRFYDITGGGGYFTVNGVPQPSGRVIEVPANQLNSVRFVGGSTPGDDRVAISAYDGNLWSNWNLFSISTDTADNSLGTARSINLTSSTQSLRENVSNYDPYDYYQFTLNGRTRVDLGLSNLTGNADLHLLNSSGATLASSVRSGTSNESLVRELNPGTYFVRVNRMSNDASYNFNYRGIPVATGPQFTSFSVMDASGDGTNNAVFQRGALRFNWGTNVTPTSVRMYARNNSTGAITDLGSVSNGGLVNLNTRQLYAGNYSIYAEARDASNNVGRSAEVAMRVLAFNPYSSSSIRKGDFKDNVSTFSGMTEGSVFIGRGGSDTLDLSGISSSNVTFNPNLRAVFGGTTFDWMRINSTGQEIYFQGYEKLRFANGQVFDLGVTPNDPLFSQQWNLGMMDIPGAWRFTKGSSNVLLGNIDSGLNSHEDISRIIPYSSQADDDSTGSWRGHGAGVQGIMAATADNATGIAGINWNSQTYVIDVGNASDSLSGTSALSAIGNYARNTGRKAVANNSWGYAPGTPLYTSHRDAMNNAAYRDSTLYMFSSGNDDVYPVNSPARWSTELDNVMAVGAVDDLGRRIRKGQASSAGGLNWLPSRWGSNYGTGLSLVAPTIVPSTHIDGSYYQYSDSRHYAFGGTSAAAPNASGVASLVWSANSNLESSDIKDILMSTANDKFGHYNSNEYGAGIVDAEAAVRRADALLQNSAVANLYNHNGLFFV
ncbi:S8 family serine peptidase [Lusitaniella coriacea]|uniref:S8 family serine peptidase n=1 Tax=Lusitaniella coriacea TaxID=1983105 RepID=UPI003CEB057A